MKILKEKEDLSIVAAVETLSNIADLEFGSIMLDPRMKEEKKDPSTIVQTVRWLHQKNAERMNDIIREKFQIVLNYLKHFYRAEKERFARKESIEGIRTIMLLVDEAANNLDKYTSLFLGSQQKSVKNSKEFVGLCDFYKKKIIPIATHSSIASWIGSFPIETILEKAQKPAIKWTEIPALSVLSVELEGLKNDLDYELLFLRQPDGTRFFAPKFLRTLKLASDVEGVSSAQNIEIEKEISALAGAQISSEIRYLLGEVYPLMDSFFHMAGKANEHQAYLNLYQTCVALIAASVQAIRQPTQTDKKGVFEYFHDFSVFLKEEFHFPEFQRLMTYPPHNEYSWEYSVFRLIQAFSSAIVAGAPLSPEFVQGIKGLVSQALARAAEQVAIPDGTVSRQLTMENSALRLFFKELKNTTLSRLIHMFEGEGWTVFEPLLGESIPTHLFDLSWRGALIPVVRLPSPTSQEYINKASISDVFQLAIHRHLSQKKACLIINLQDRTSWKESARALAIEEFCSKGEKDERLFVLTQNRGGDFYLQAAEYANMHSAPEFKEALLSHLTEPGSGAFWPLEENFTHELKSLIDSIHTLVFGEKNVLSRERRLEFIELTYTIMMLRAIGSCHPDVIFVSCKNGLDVTISSICSLFSFLSLIRQNSFSQDDVDWLRAILFGLVLVKRQRLIFPDRQERVCKFIQFLEKTISTLGKVEERSLYEAITHFLPHEIFKANLLPASGHIPSF
jgi:hypothetical protein